MSYFISFEPLIIPVYARCFFLYAVLLSTRQLHHDPASDSHDLQEKDKEQVTNKVNRASPLVFSPFLTAANLQMRKTDLVFLSPR